MIKTIVRSGVLIAALSGITSAGYAQPSDASVILQFQRAADTYVFIQRQDERRGASSMRQVEGELFTPLAATAFRARIRGAASECDLPGRGEGGFVVPSVSTSAADTESLPACLTAVLPHLPSELEYRAAGVALVLVDRRRNIVVDVLHAAFP